MKRVLFLTLVASLTIIIMVSCSPQKYTPKSIKPCSEGGSSGLLDISRGGVPYTTMSPNNCVSAISPFDLSVWHESAMASYKVRGDKTVELGCRTLTAAVDNCDYCGVTGSSNSLLMNFNPEVYPQNGKVKRAVVAIYSPGDVHCLKNANLLGRLSVGGEMVSLAKKRDIVIEDSKYPDHGWVLFDITYFAARAINERRNSIHFEVSMACETTTSSPCPPPIKKDCQEDVNVPCPQPVPNLVSVGVNRNEPQLLVEFN